MRIVIAVVLGVLVGACAHAPRAARWSAPGDSPIGASSADLRVEGLDCALCAAQLEKSLVSVPGVARADADAASGVVRVRFQGAARPTGKQLARAVSDAGLELTGIGR